MLNKDFYRAGKRWTKEEIEFLENNFGKMTVYGLSKKMGRSENSVHNKIVELKLGSFSENKDYLSACELAKILHVGLPTITETYIKNNGLPCKKKMQSKKYYCYAIKIDTFWEWAKLHQDILHLERLEKNDLGKEPDWVDKKRRNDFKNPFNKCKFSKSDELKIINDIKKMKYKSCELSDMYGVDYKYLNRLVHRYGIKERPLPDNYGRITWNDEKDEMLINLIVDGCSWNEICNRMNVTRSGAQKTLLRMFGHCSKERIKSELR